MFNPSEQGFDNDDLLLAANAFKRISTEYGKSTPELRDCVRRSTNLFLHYIIDGCIQLHQNGPEDEKPVAVKASDIVKTLESSGFTTIARKCQYL